MARQCVLVASSEWLKLAELAPWVAALAAALAVLGVAVWLLRRWLLRRESSAGGPGLTIDQIEAMHQAGTISDEEFRILRRTALPLDSQAGKNDEPDVQDAASDADD